MTSRRQAVKMSGAVVAGLALASGALVRANTQERVKLGLIGCGGQGKGLLKRFLSIPNVDVAYVCDPDSKHVGEAAELVSGQRSQSAQTVSDLRRVLDDKTVDAVVVATPDHWHAPAAILACDAGKHVYVEKPCAHNLREGQLLVAAAKRNGRLVQHGTQSRSMPLIAHAVQALHDGVIGKVMMATAFNIQARNNIGHSKPSDSPDELDYDLWIGPAPMVPYQSNRNHYNWHWWYAFGTGDAGNDGVHELDIARWGLGEQNYPSSVAAVGGKYFFDDDQQFPDTQTVIFDYPHSGQVGQRRQLTFEMRIWSPYQPNDGVDNGVTFFGTEGWMLLSKRGVVKTYGRKNKPITLPGKPDDLPGHQENFINAICNGDKLTASIEIGNVSASLCHYSNIAVRVGRSLAIDPTTGAILNDGKAQDLASRTYREGHWAVPKSV